MEIDKLLENLAVISQILKTPSLTNQIDKDPEFGKKIKTIAPWREWKMQSRADLIKYAKMIYKKIIERETLLIQETYLKKIDSKYLKSKN